MVGITGQAALSELYFLDAIGLQGLDTVGRTSAPVAKHWLNKLLFQQEFDQGLTLSPASKAQSVYHRIQAEAEADEVKRNAKLAKQVDFLDEEDEISPPRPKRRRLSAARRSFLMSKNLSADELAMFEDMED